MGLEARIHHGGLRAGGAEKIIIIKKKFKGGEEGDGRETMGDDVSCGSRPQRPGLYKASFGYPGTDRSRPGTIPS